MMKVNYHSSRAFRQQLLLRAQAGKYKVKLLSPKTTGKPSWRFAIQLGDTFFVFGRPMQTRAMARRECQRRYGVKGTEYRRRSQKSQKPKRQKVA